MTVVYLSRSRNGQFRSCRAEGHSGYAPSGSDIVCAAVTVLLRTTLQVLSESFGSAVKTDITSRGNLAFRVDDFAGGKSCRLIYAADFLRSGLTALQNEYPDCVTMREQIED
ncbi:ribosomal-processing cysteine protease Prp [Treponema brennaborense]|uniref:Ribosomal processing cysteine protease Prp n=1 Tax=Treponema brennaborense (strain DSM 12168 / CIP 105900 / DD5/3) TaxID=906968 RepID=F4LQJ3_TREBD|nr:ribosomal-processing cysteine protease Prp [Treponema brennaborense]AEE17202.1 protein of unknown function DUF464 [Treponema brennaborense DSM 12168]